MKLLNIRKSGWVRGGVYIGRKPGTPLHYGNPFKIGKDGTRDEVCDKYKRWLQGDKEFKDLEPLRRGWILEHVHELIGKKLLCFCSPKRCHGETLMEIAKARHHI